MLKRFLHLVLAALLWPLSGMAQSVELGEFPAVQTRLGTLITQKVTQWGDHALMLQGASSRLVEDFRVTIKGAFSRPGEAVDWVIVETSHSGNMCPSGFVILRLGADGIRRTGKFADCLGGLRDTRILEGRVEMDFADPDPRIEYQTFSYDGTNFTVASVERPNDGTMPGGGADVTRWIGQHVNAPMSDPQERRRFGTIMSDAQFAEMDQRIAIGRQGTQVGGWVTGYGCWPHECNASWGVWGIRISDGKPMAVFFNAGQPPKLFGTDLDYSDPFIRYALDKAQP